MRDLAFVRKEESADTPEPEQVKTAIDVLVHTPFSPDNFTEFTNQLGDLIVGEKDIGDMFSISMQELRMNAFLSIYETHSVDLWDQIQLKELEVYLVREQEQMYGENISTALPLLPSEYNEDKYIAEDVYRDASSVYDTHEKKTGDILNDFLVNWLFEGKGELADAFVEVMPQFELIMHRFEEEKAAQVADVTVQKGTNDAVRTFAQDASSGHTLTVDKDGTYTRKSFEDVVQDAQTQGIVSEDFDVTVIYTRYGEAYIAVMPQESSSDICSVFAGNIYHVEDIDAIPEFPIHPNCPHEIVYLFNLQPSDLSEAA